MLSKGIREFDPDKKVTVIPKESEAITHAITTAQAGSMIVICSDVVPEALAQVKKYKEEESNQLFDYLKKGTVDMGG